MPTFALPFFIPRIFLFVKQRLKMLAAMAVTAFALSACNEDAIIRSSLTPAVDNIHTFGLGSDFNNGSDTMQELSIRSGTVFQDSVITSTRNNGFPIYHALGAMTDPFAGRTTAGIFLQFVPTTTGVALTGNLDSLVVVLPYSGFTWGDTLAPLPLRQQHNIRVYAINEGFSKDSTFYNYSSKGTDAAVLGTATLITGRKNLGTIEDSVATGVNKIKRAPHLRIKLTDAAFIAKFKAALAYDTSYAAFTTQFPGLYIMADSNGGNPAARTLPYFRLNGPTSLYGTAAILAYQNGSDTAIQFPYSETYAAHFNRIRRNYFGFNITGLLNNYASQHLAMQNAPGAAIDLELPYIQNLISKGNIIINKAEICFTTVTAPSAIPSDAEDVKFFPPIRLYAQGINSSGGQYTIADRYPINDESLAFIDGTATRVVRNGVALTEYRINIPREVQAAIVAKAGGVHLRIGGTVNFPAAYRLVVAGPQYPTAAYRPRINIIYSKQ